MTPHPLQTLDHWAANSVAAAHGLREFPVHEGLGALVGVAGEDPIAMRTRVFQSERWARWLVARIDRVGETDQPWSVTLIGLPAAVSMTMIGGWTRSAATGASRRR
jgi:hypothetical protein